MARKKPSEQPSMYTEEQLPDQRMKEWLGMPEYVSENLKPHKSVDVQFKDGTTLHVHVESDDDWSDFQKVIGHQIGNWVSCYILPSELDTREAFAKVIGQTVTESTTYLWHPDVLNMSTARFRYIEDRDERWAPKYPVYIISKGRAESRLTARALDYMHVPYNIVIEPQEWEQYSAVIDFDKIRVLPFSNLGKGSIPARNWVWQDAIDRGAKRHWILDDNIRGFFRLNRNKKIEVTTGAIFRCAEDFVDRYDNVAIAGFNYCMFAKVRDELPAFLLNRRIYSCILIRNDLDLRAPAAGPVPECTEPWWRGRYNEDTDLSIRALKQKWCTVLFYTFLCYKEATLTMKGGNTDELYQGDGRLQMAESLRAQHPDITTIYHKFGIQRVEGEVTQRAQHLVDYSGFKRNVLKLAQETIDNPPQGVNEYNMVLKEFAEGSKELEK